MFHDPQHCVQIRDVRVHLCRLLRRAARYYTDHGYMSVHRFDIELRVDSTVPLARSAPYLMEVLTTRTYTTSPTRGSGSSTYVRNH